MPECQKIAGTEVNQHSGDTLALNVPVETYITAATIIMNSRYATNFTRVSLEYQVMHLTT